VSLLTGFFWVVFGLAEGAVGVMKSPPDYMVMAGGIIEALTFGLPFLVIAWLLWWKPKAGSILLMIVGAAFAVWMAIGWTVINWIVPVVLVGIPLILGGYTLIREISKPMHPAA
ncbi:MAG TPA: hypothetical protein VGB30_10680, partial [bacterium]